MSAKRWVIAPSAPANLLARYAGMSSFLAQALYNRGFVDPASARQFLESADPAVGRLLDYRRRPAVDKAVMRIRQAIRSGELIIVYGDFDADGVTSTALLVQVLGALGAHVAPYIPHRVDEGYGLNGAALQKLARRGARLVITVDCGIRSVEDVAEGRARGLDIIITDHHSIGPELPPAYAVINPKLDDCPYTEAMLAGVGVAYRLAEALLAVDRQMRRSPGPALDPECLLDLVAIGTVADLAPLNRPENRALVRRGLEVINKAQRPGVRALIEVANMKTGELNASSIGYGLGPRINAAGRLESAMLAYDLLTATDYDHALRLAQQLHDLNVQRQELTRAAQALIRERLEADDQASAPLIFAKDRAFKPGIVGLVAGRLAEEYYRPAIVLEEGATESRASCRSIPGFDITHALDQCADLLVRHGGHAQAAGFTVVNENIEALRQRLLAIAEAALSEHDLRPTVEVDVEVPVQSISLALAEELALLEPTGHHNPLPVFITRGLRVVEARAVGREGQHLKLKLAGEDGSAHTVDAIGFHMAEQMPGAGEVVDLVYQLEVNAWNGSRVPQLHLEDIQPACMPAINLSTGGL